MLKFTDIKQVYFLGIGGIGMSALARYFAGQGIVQKIETTRIKHQNV
jgi:UDP-N-acetylmuramate-alanine ligase